MRRKYNPAEMLAPSKPKPNVPRGPKPIPPAKPPSK